MGGASGSLRMTRRRWERNGSAHRASRSIPNTCAPCRLMLVKYFVPAPGDQRRRAGAGRGVAGPLLPLPQCMGCRGSNHRPPATANAPPKPSEPAPCRPQGHANRPNRPRPDDPARVPAEPAAPRAVEELGDGSTSIHYAEDDQTIKQIAKLLGLGVKEIVALNKNRRGMKKA